MKIRLTLEVENPQDVDDESRTGLTEDAYDSLVDALADLGLGVVDGPTAMIE
jgi:hypothetical protein